MTDRASVSTAIEHRQDESSQWWGYSKEHGWVVLDRTLPCNVPGLKVDLLFLRCRDVTSFSEKRERWVPPHYQFAPNHIRGLAVADSGAANDELTKLQLRWPEFEREVQLVYRNTQEGLAAPRAGEDKPRKQPAAETKKPAASAKA
jgi:hypothetical protein